MSEHRSWLHVRAAGMDLLLSTLELREVLEPTPISPLPGRSRGIQGVMVYQGEFMPILAWEDLPGIQALPAKPIAMAVLRPRLALPIEALLGMVSPPQDAWLEIEEGRAEGHWSGGACRLGDLTPLLVDSDRLITLVQRLREEP